MLHGYRKLFFAILVLIAIIILAFADKLTEWVAASLSTMSALFNFGNVGEHYMNYKQRKSEIETQVHHLSDVDLARRASDGLR